MLDRLAALAHRLRIGIEALLHGFQYMLVLPSLDATLISLRTLRLERTVAARPCPIMAQRLAILLVRVTIGQLLARRTAIDILRRQVAKALLAKAATLLRARGHRLWQRHRNAGIIASLDFRAVVVPTIGDSIEMLSTEDLLGLHSHVRKL